MDIRKFFVKKQPKKFTAIDEIVDLYLGGHLSDAEKWRVVFDSGSTVISVSRDSKILKLDSPQVKR